MNGVMRSVVLLGVCLQLGLARAESLQEVPFEVGARNQIRLRHDAEGRFADQFEIRNIAANGVVWDGTSGVRDCASEHLRAPGGETFRVFVLDAGDESMTVLSSREWKSDGSARP